MSQGNLERVREIFLSARGLPADQRAAFLKSACSDDTDLHREVEQLLANDDGATVSVATTESSPRGILSQIGPYRILELLGEGGMGTVYKAEQRAPLKRTVAIKVVKAGFDTAEVLARFQAEHQALARLDHPNIARVFDAGTTELGRPYFVMEYLPGQPITRFCDDNKLSIRQRLELFHQACDAITHAHIKAIVHRDIKASNVLAFMQDGKPMVKVIDFGIAKALTGDRLTDLTFNTGRGVVVGTYDSMSPEQAAGSLDIDTRTDVYSMGVLLYELLTGAKPFDVRTFAEAADGEIRRIIREVDPPRPSTRFSSLGENVGRIALVRQSKVDQLARDLKSDLGWIPLKAMRKERRDRYASPLQMSEDIDNYLHGRPLIAGPESQIYRLRKFAIRNAKPLAVVVCLILTTLAAIGFYIRSIRAVSDRKLYQANADKKLALERIQEQQSKLISSNLEQAELAAQRGKWPDSLASLDAARNAGADESATILLGRILSLQNLGRSTDAQHAMDEAIRSHPDWADDPVVMARRGELLWSVHPEEGERLLRQAIQLKLPPAEMAFAHGLLAESISEAIVDFKQAVAADPFRQDAIGLVAILSTLSGQWADADEYAIAWQGKFPDDPSARIMRSIQLALRGDGAGATRLLDQPLGVIDPKIRPDVKRLIDLLVKLVNGGLIDGSFNPADAVNFAQILWSREKTVLDQSNLLFPKVVVGSANGMLDGVKFQSDGANFDKIGWNSAAIAQYDQAASAYAQVEKKIPIGIFTVMRAGALADGKHLREAAAAYETAADAPSPLDIRGYAHLEAAFNCYYANLAEKMGQLPAVGDPRVVLHLRKAIELGAVDSSDFYTQISTTLIVVGRHADDARAVLDHWRHRSPNEPLVGVWEAENEYLAGNYSSAFRLVNDLDHRFPRYDFSAMADLRNACLKAIEDRRTGPPPIEEKVLDVRYTVPLRPTTKP